MSFSRELVERDGWYHLASTGKIETLEELLSKFHMGVEMVQKKYVKRVLVDDRKLHVSVDPLDISLAIDQLLEDGLQFAGLRIACLCRPEDVQIYKTSETMYRNRSIRFTLFNDEGAAVDWLRA